MASAASDAVVDQDAKIIESTQDLVHVMSIYCSTLISKYCEGEQRPVLSFAIVDRYVNAKKFSTLLEKDLLDVGKKSAISYNHSVRRDLSRLIDKQIEAAERVLNTKSQHNRVQRVTLSVISKRAIVQKILKEEDLISLLDTLFQFEMADTVSKLIEEVRHRSHEDQVRADILKALCVDKLFGLFAQRL